MIPEFVRYIVAAVVVIGLLSYPNVRYDNLHKYLNCAQSDF